MDKQRWIGVYINHKKDTAYLRSGEDPFDLLQRLTIGKKILGITTINKRRRKRLHDLLRYLKEISE
ncbi:MAG: hypothetical protein H6791_02180 [Candidatus Nomurabacteria bacterium]|nr:MAG: hypothetical protein H6791_02180 [Candidatus Nomurabacteria bacterium]